MTAPAGPRTFEPDLLWNGRGFSRGTFRVRSGVIEAWGGAAPDAAIVQRLPGLAVLPGFVNSHSHAFQRLLRGRAERPEPQGSFWTWRAQMYRLVEQLTPELLEECTTLAYRELRDAGYTRVKEFHYLHHGKGGVPYQDPNELALRVRAAAERAGIRLELLRAVYLRGDEPAQARFRDHSLDAALARTEALAATGLRVGLAPHSVRAVPREALGEAAAWARDRGMELHMHLAEQPREVDQCLAETGLRPVELAAERGMLGRSFVGVHLTHLAPHEARAVGEAGATACLCPTTEANLGDGLPALDALVTAGARLAIGSDSQAHIDPFLELRGVEYHGRLAALARTRLHPVELLKSALEPHAVGDEARWVAVRLDDPALADVPVERLADGLVMSATRGVIALTAVGDDVRPVDPSLGPDLRAFRGRYPGLGS